MKHCWNENWRENRSAWRKVILASFCASKIPNRLTCEGIQSTLVTSRHLTGWLFQCCHDAEKCVNRKKLCYQVSCKWTFLSISYQDECCVTIRTSRWLARQDSPQFPATDTNTDHVIVSIPKDKPVVSREIAG